MTSLRSIALVSLVLVLPATAFAETAAKVPKVVRQAASAKRVVSQLNGLSVSPMGTLAIWRDRSLRTPELVRAMKQIKSYLRAQEVVQGKDSLNVSIAGGKLLVTADGQLRAEHEGYRTPLIANDVVDVNASKVAAEIKYVAKKIALDQPVTTRHVGNDHE